MNTEDIIKKAIEDISKLEVENPWTRITRENCHEIPFGRILINDGNTWFAYLEEVIIKKGDFNVTFVVAKSDKVEKVSRGDYPLYWMLAPKGPEQYKNDNV
jgi:hypothetical protein